MADQRVVDASFAPIQGGATVTTATLAADGFGPPAKLRGNANLWLSGTWAGTVTLQASHDDGATWAPVGTFTTPQRVPIFEPEAGVTYRAGFLPGGHTSGTAVVRLSQ